MRFRIFLFTLLSALLLPLALPNDLYIYGNPLLGFICLAPYFLSIALAPTFRFSSVLGVVFGGVSTVLVHYWLLFYGEYSFWTVSGVTLGYMGYHALLAPMLRGLSRTRPTYRVFLLAAGWAVYEYLKSSGFLGFPWGLLPHAINTVDPLVQIVDITGIWGLSLLLALSNAWFAELALSFYRIYRQERKALLLQLAFVVILIAATLGYGVYSLWRDIPYSAHVRVLLVQNNEDPWSSGRSAEAIVAAQNLTLRGLGKTASGNENQPDVIVWSETAVRYYIREEQFGSILKRVPKQRPLYGFIRELDSYFLIGAPFRPVGESRFYNASLLISPEGELLDYYGKQHLVPFAEVVPFWGFFPVRYFFGEILGLAAGWGIGTEATIFELPLSDGQKLRFGTPICFEDAYPDLCRKFIRKGADAWINLTNVSWSRRESAEIQMLVAARFRSIENRRVMIRCTNGGVTSIIGAKGEITRMLGLFRQDTLAAEVPIYRPTSPTIYTLFGDYLPIVLAMVLLGFLSLNAFRSLIYRKGCGESDLSPLRARYTEENES